MASPPPDATKTPSGLALKVLKRGRGKDRPSGNDCVKLHYTASKRNGEFMGSTHRWGEPEGQCLASMFPGVAEAVKDMRAGELRRLWVPAILIKRAKDDDDEEDVDKAPPLDVTFDIELVDVIKAPPTPADLRKAPSAAVKLPSGLALLVLKRGTGKDRPNENSRVTLIVSGWTTDGKLVESSVMGGRPRPASHDMVGVIRGWREALLRMVAGEKVRAWIPAGMAYGERPRRGQPKGDLVYELELVSIDY